MAEVYWIHTEEQTDLFTSGYIGFTSRTASERFKEHLKESKSRRRKDVIHKAILKYGDKLILDTLMVCSNEYGLWLEEKLRPAKKIGWNIQQGGSKPPSALGREVTPDQRAARSVRMKKSGIRPPSNDPEVKAKMIATKKEKGTWNLKQDTQLFRFWAKADIIFKLYTKFPSINTEVLCQLIGENFSKRVHDITRYIRDKGFNPLENEQWKRDFVFNSCDRLDEITETDLLVLTPHYKHSMASPFWSRAEEAFNLLTERPTITMFQANSYFNLPDKSIAKMYNKIKAGWVPLQDTMYVAWLTKQQKEQHAT